MNKFSISFDKKKGITGSIIGAVILAICYGWYETNMGISFAVMFITAGFIKIDLGSAKKKYIAYFIWSLLLLVYTWFAPILMLNIVHMIDTGFMRLALNIICMLIVSGILFLVTAKRRTSLIGATFLLMLLATANYFIYQFRGKELSPLDFLSIKTAAEVAGQYSLEVSKTLFYSWVWWLWISFLGFSFLRLPKFPKKKARTLTIAVEIILIIVLWFMSSFIQIKLWYDQGSSKNGYYLNFFLGVRNSLVDEPKNYSLDFVEEITKDYNTVLTSAEEKDHPNIIVIMNESFADFRIFGKELLTSEPITPFIDSLSENTIKGYALTSVFGGNTANAEFEFLTGHSMANLPENSVPYQQYIRSDIYNLVNVMNNNGYSTHSSHPYYPKGWSRNTLYPKLGFENSTFIDDYPQQKYLRKYISDQEMYEYLLSNINTKEQDTPMFLFGITMQNHGGYEYDEPDFTNTVTLDGYSSAYPKAEQYFSVLKESDKAMEYFLGELSNYPEDTIVVFFGDHFPKVETEFYEELHDGKFDTLPEQMLQYTIPFFIWANYDIPEKTIECTSINYLSNHILKLADISLPPYYQFMADLEENIPAMNSLGYFSKEKNTFIPYTKASGDEKEWLNKYACVQYNNIFDTKNADVVFFQNKENK
ncbi:MAG: LTA synthase family protein [Ruminococcaceae bacterium]|nr:LTA synthase family protein [Oscillospiraceae bacterium]